MTEPAERGTARAPATALWLAPTVVLVLALLATGTLMAWLAHATAGQDRAAFEHEMARSVDAIRDRVDTTITLLRGTAGLFVASEHVERGEFERYIDRLLLRENYPGILGIGFSRRVRSGALDELQQRMRAEGHEDFRVWPVAPRRAERHSIVYLEPLDERNRAAIGYDMASEPTRRAAMEAARDSGSIAASGKVTLVQEIHETKQAGFLLYLPLYEGAAPPATVEERRARLFGFVYSPLRASDLLEGIRGSGVPTIDIEVFDGTEPLPGRLMHSTSEPHANGGHAPHFVQQRVVDVAGRPWLVRVTSRDELESLSQNWVLPWMGIAAVATSLLLASITLVQARARHAAESAAAAQRRVAAALHQEREWFRTTLTGIGDAVVAVDAADRVVLMNPAAEQLTGWRAEDADGRGLDEVVHVVDDGEGDHALTDASRAAQRSISGELVLRAHDGGTITVEHSTAPLHDGDGEREGAVIVLRDISERRRHEAAVRASEERERERSQRLQRLATATPLLNSAADLDTLVAAIEREARRLLDAPDAQLVFGRRAPAAAGGLVVPLTGRDGRVTGHLRLAPRPQHPYGADDEALLRHLAGIAAIAVRNARLYAELRDNDRRKDEFLATLAHELRNPLAPISSALDILQRQPQGPAAERARAIAHRQVRHMVRLVDDLLDLSRISRGKIELRREPVALSAVLDSALEASAPLIEDRGHRLQLQCARPGPLVDGDPARLSQVFSNLLNNAAKYTPPGGLVEVEAGVEDGQARVSVRDNGSGIDPADLRRVFDLFAQPHRSPETSSGLGVGLTLVRRLTEMHGGSVEARSEGRGHGAEFVVRLPLAAAADAVVVPAAGRGTDAGTALPPLRILVVDDNLDAADTLAAALRLDGHQVAVAHDGPAALETVAAFAPQAVLLDIGLPGLNGYEVARRLRRAYGPQLRLIAVTGWGQGADQQQAREAGFDRHMVKPIDHAQLVAQLSELLPPG